MNLALEQTSQFNAIPHDITSDKQASTCGHTSGMSVPAGEKKTTHVMHAVRASLVPAKPISGGPASRQGRAGQAQPKSPHSGQDAADAPVKSRWLAQSSASHRMAPQPCICICVPASGNRSHPNRRIDRRRIILNKKNTVHRFQRENTPIQ